MTEHPGADPLIFSATRRCVRSRRKISARPFPISLSTLPKFPILVPKALR